VAIKEFFRHFSPNPTAFRRKALSEQPLAMISASASDNRSSERLSLIDRRTLESSAKGNYRPLAASPSPSCSRRLSGSARSVELPRNYQNYPAARAVHPSPAEYSRPSADLPGCIAAWASSPVEIRPTLPASGRSRTVLEHMGKVVFLDYVLILTGR